MKKILLVFIISIQIPAAMTQTIAYFGQLPERLPASKRPRFSRGLGLRLPVPAKMAAAESKLLKALEYVAVPLPLFSLDPSPVYAHLAAVSGDF
jgi:hypothetical protein